MRILYATIAILTALLVHAPGNALAEDIHFQDVSAPGLTVSRDSQVKAVRTRLVKIDAEAFLRSAIRANKKRQKLKVFTFEDDHVELTIKTIANGFVGKSKIIDGYVGNDKYEYFTGSVGRKKL